MFKSLFCGLVVAFSSLYCGKKSSGQNAIVIAPEKKTVPFAEVKSFNYQMAQA
jgi:hypothetical protein